jgi:uncharacterized iron-regulated membrane protein
MTARKVLLWVHLWLGLTLGAFTALLGLSGSAMVFSPQIEARLHPHKWQVAPQNAPYVPIAAIEKNLKQAHPQSKLQLIRLPQRPNDVYEAWLDKGELRVNLDPYSGEILGSQSAAESLHGWLFVLHTELFLGERGETISGVVGIGLFLLSATGIVLWWPRKGDWKAAFAYRSRAARRPGFNLHRFLGWLSCVFLLMLSLTGIALVFDDAAAKVAGGLFGTAPQEKPQSKYFEGARDISLDQATQIAQRTLPGAKLFRVVPAAKKDATIVVRLKFPEELHPNGMSNVHLDRYTGTALRVDDGRHPQGGARWMNLRYPLHIGRWGGVLSQALQVILGLMPAILYVTGLMMWWNRVQARRRAKLARQLRQKQSETATTLA